MPSLCESGENEEAEWEESAGDYVFRIVNNAIGDKEGARKQSHLVKLLFDYGNIKTNNLGNLTVIFSSNASFPIRASSGIPTSNT